MADLPDFIPDNEVDLYLSPGVASKKQIVSGAQPDLPDFISDNDLPKYLAQPEPKKYQLSADRNQSYAEQIPKAIVDAPEAFWKNFIVPTYQALNPWADVKDEQGNIIKDGGGLYDTIKRAGALKTAETTGTLSSATAGAVAGAPIGQALIPIPIAGAAIGGGIGAGLGLLGFDLASTLTKEGVQGKFAPSFGTNYEDLINMPEIRSRPKLLEAIQTNPEARKYVEQQLADYNYNKFLTEGKTQGWTSAFLNNLPNMGMQTEQGFKPASDYAKELIYNSTQGAAAEAMLRPGFSAAKKLPVVRNFTDAYQRKQVRKTLEAKDPNLAAKIDEGLQYNADNPYLDYMSTGEVSGSLPIKAEEFVLQRGEKGYGKFAERQQARNDFRLKQLSKITEPGANIDDAVNAIVKDVEQSVTDVSRSLDPLPISEADISNLGSQGQAALSKASRKMSKAASQKFENLPDSEIPSMQGVQDAAKATVEHYYRDKSALPSDEIINLVEDLNKAKQVEIDTGVPGKTSTIYDASGKPIVKPVSQNLLDWQGLRRRAGELSQRGDARSRAVADQIIEHMDTYMKEQIQNGLISAEAGAQLLKGIELWNLHKQLYYHSSNPNRTILARQSGKFKVPEDKVMGQYFKPGAGGRSAARAFVEGVKGSPEGLQAFKDYIIDHYRKNVLYQDAQGNIKVSVDKANRWFKQYSEALKDFPELRDTLSKPRDAQFALEQKYGELRATARELETAALDSTAAIDSGTILPKILSSGDRVVKLTKLVSLVKKTGDKVALKGLRRSIQDYMRDIGYEQGAGRVSIEEAATSNATFDGIARPVKIANKWQSIREAVVKSKALTESQIKAFDSLYGDIRSEQSIQAVKAPGSPTSAVQNAITGMYKWIQKGVTAHPTIGTPLKFLIPVLQGIPEGKFMAIMEEAILNPRYARDLMQKATPKNVNRMAIRLFGADLNSQFSQAPVRTSLAIGRAAAKPGIVKPPSREEVLAKKSFPTPEELLRPPAEGSLTDYSTQDFEKKNINFDGGNMDNYAKQAHGLVSAVIKQESNGNPNAVSHKGATGLMQIMPATGAEIAKELRMPNYDLNDPETNKAFGTYYLGKMLKMFNGDEQLALAAYNAGAGRVKQWIDKWGNDWENISRNLEQQGSYLETVNYVPSVLRKRQLEQV